MTTLLRVPRASGTYTFAAVGATGLLVVVVELSSGGAVVVVVVGGVLTLSFRAAAVAVSVTPVGASPCARCQVLRLFIVVYPMEPVTVSPSSDCSRFTWSPQELRCSTGNTSVCRTVTPRAAAVAGSNVAVAGSPWAVCHLAIAAARALVKVLTSEVASAGR